jgi:hypothetical protein
MNPIPSVMGDYMVGADKTPAVKTYMPMEVMEDEESGEETPRTPPEGIRNPGIQVIIGRRRRVIGHYRGTIVIIVMIDYFGSRTRGGTLGGRLHLQGSRLSGR